MGKSITIGREFGSGGRELGRRLAEILGIAYYDREILTEIAKRTSLSEQYVHQVVERHPSPLFPITVGRSFYPADDPAMTMAHSVFAEQARIIREMAEKSDCVIVGRCADYVLRESEPFRIFVYADMPSKISRCFARSPEDEQLTESEMKKRIVSIDRHRAKYYEYYTGQEWGDKRNYDLCVNTTNKDIKVVAHSIARLFD